ncbi:hypothetical protein V500_05030 [Pseudogymnoascus sp. VKM F-4518 (FW-2643)]|nr:hypothetical protein V500_05030 [Pseudogymnoascus sp. VKM F-4518 (FW-2643)]
MLPAPHPAPTPHAEPTLFSGKAAPRKCTWSGAGPQQGYFPQNKDFELASRPMAGLPYIKHHSVPARAGLPCVTVAPKLPHGHDKAPPTPQIKPS